MTAVLITRKELWHPLLVHLPVTTLLLASVAGLLYFVVKNDKYKDFIEKFTWVILLTGVLGAWVAIYSGQVAYNIEVRKICDPKVLQEHQWWSFASAISYSVALLALVVKLKLSIFKKPLNALLLIAYTFGFGAIMYAGHLGATVVYEQGAAVNKPKDDCSDYIIK